MSKIKVETSINGETVEFLCEPQQTLLEVLREELSRLGTKEGCGTGDCGACSVLLNDRLVCSCLVLAVESEGAEVTTIEGLAQGETLDPLQQAFIDKDALMCGFCTPGMIMAAKGLLLRLPTPNDSQIREGLSGNLCRCATYPHVFDAVKAASGKEG